MASIVDSIRFETPGSSTIKPIPAPGGERSPASLSASPNERFRPVIERQFDPSS
jgi:hypothetical protein